MIKEQTTYTVVCDKCKNEHDSWHANESYDDALDNAEDAGWIISVDGCHYCPDCQEEEGGDE